MTTTPLNLSIDPLEPCFVEPYMTPPPNARDFLAQLDQLERDHNADTANPGSYRCEGCARCAGCMFCTQCSDCTKCTYCTDCTHCTKCTHCTDCAHTHASAYCVASSNCTGSQYLILCRACDDCTFCFGCVGLKEREFHILNQPYDRKTYFKVVTRLKKELGMRS